MKKWQSWLVGSILFLCVGLVAVVATPYLFNPATPNGAYHSNQPPLNWIYDQSGALVGVTTNAGIDSYFTLNAANTATPTLGTANASGVYYSGVVAGEFGGVSSVGSTQLGAYIVGYTPNSFKLITYTTSASGVINMPSAPNGWNCAGNDLSTSAVFPAQTSSTPSTVTIQGEARVTNALQNFAASDVLGFQCAAY